MYHISAICLTACLPQTNTCWSQSQTVENLLQLCNELEELTLLQDPQMVNDMLRSKKSKLEEEHKALEEALPYPFSQLEATIDKMIADDHDRTAQQHPVDRL